MPTAIESKIKDRISAFVSELDLLVRKSTLEALQGVLSNGAAPARVGRPAGVSRGPGRPKGSGRSKVNLEEASAKIVAHVQANDGQGIGAISAATGVDLKTAKKAAIALLAAGTLKKSGQKRGTVYHIGSGRAPRAGAPGKRGARKAKKVTTRRRKPAAARSQRKVVITPTRRRAAPSSKPVATRRVLSTDVPEALAG